MRADFIYNLKIRKSASIIILGLLLIAGFYFRFQGIRTRGLEYDEIWTYIYYCPKDLHGILTELSTPNNHPLNTLAIKLTKPIMGANPFSMRFPAFISGIFFLFLIFNLTKKAFNSRLAAVLALTFAAFNGALIHFSQTARGYEMQCLFIMLFLTGLFYLNGSNESKRKIMWGIITVSGAVLSILTLSTSILFIVPAIGIYCVWKSYKQKNIIFLLEKNNREILVSFTFIALFSLFWYSINYHQFIQSKSSFATHFNTFMYALKIYAGGLLKLAPLWLYAILFFLLIRRKSRKLFLICIIIILFPFISSPFVGLGPPRVYLPLLLILSIAAGVASSELISVLSVRLKSKSISWIMASILIGVSYINMHSDINKWMPIDWKAKFPEITKNLPENIYVCFPPADTFSIKYNCISSLKDNQKRLACLGNFFLNVNGNGKISGIIPKLKGTNKTLDLSPLKPLKNFRCSQLLSMELYSFNKPDKSNFKKDKILFALLKPTNKDIFNRHYATVTNSAPWVLINCHFNSSIINSRGCLLAIEIKDFPFSLEDLKTIEFNSGKKIEFFTVGTNNN